MNNPQPWWLTVPPAEVAARILPYFSSFQKEPASRMMKGIVGWLKTGSNKLPGTWREDTQFTDPDVGAVAEAIQVLEHAGLVMQSTGDHGYVGLTRLGRHALQTNTVRRHLGLTDAPPTA